jgi:hypothetical protein
MMLLVLALLGCDDTVFPVAVEPVEGDGWCAVENTIAGACIACHASENAVAPPDLQTDPAVILTASSASGLAFVVPGAPDESFFYRKISGELEAGEGGIMPPTGALPDAVVANVRTWIEDGAEVTDCGSGPNPSAARFHPIGWADPDVHGLEAKLHSQPCTACHGADLTGDTGPSCDTCHGTPDEAGAWRTDCTYCHGGAIEGGGTTPAPPRQIDGTTGEEEGRFQNHRIHTANRRWARNYSCDTCHVYPESATSPGHMFDDTPGVAEVSFDEGTWDGVSSCTATCHGPDPVQTDDIVTCASCHGDATDLDRLSGEHEDHVDEGITCSECHSTVDDTNQIVRINLHVDGTVNVPLPDGITRTASTNTCTGTCHGEAHDNASWD